MPSAALHEAAETLKKLNEELARMPPKTPKEHHDIDASLINSAMQPNAPWGFVIVRTVYDASSDAPWALMLELLRSQVERTLELEDQTYLLPRHELTVIEDKATLAGTDSYIVRRAFRAWVAEDLPPLFDNEELEKFGGTAQVRAKLLSNDEHYAPNTVHPVGLVPPRWQFCLFVDEDCVRSLNASIDSPYPDPALKILTTDWRHDRAALATEAFTMDWDGGETDNDCEDVGWMYMDMSDYVPVYARLVTPFNWHECYQRPYKGYVDQ
tara:strand:- start:7061 stop:7864 length:804 start_codon:yes stop_codon:yes gene_type:complete